MICPHRERKRTRKRKDRNEIQEEVVVMEKGIDQERERERDRQGHYYWWVYMELHTHPTPPPDTDITAKPQSKTWCNLSLDMVDHLPTSTYPMVFVFNFVMELKWWSSIRWFSQIWLYPRYQSRKKPDPLYILGYLLELIIKIWQFGIIFSFKIWQIWAIFFHENSSL